MAARNFVNFAAFATLNNGIVGSWSGLLNGDTANPVQVPLYADKSVSVEGTLGPATITIQGSIDGTNYYTLNDPQGNALTFVTATKRLEAVLENVAYIRPSLSGADGTTNAQVNLIAR